MSSTFESSLRILHWTLDVVRPLHSMQSAMQIRFFVSRTFHFSAFHKILTATYCNTFNGTILDWNICAANLFSKIEKFKWTRILLIMLNLDEATGMKWQKYTWATKISEITARSFIFVVIDILLTYTCRMLKNDWLNFSTIRLLYSKNLLRRTFSDRSTHSLSGLPHWFINIVIPDTECRCFFSVKTTMSYLFSSIT